MSKKFSKRAWLECANAKKEQGILTEREITTAYSTWVSEADGKTKEELEAQGHRYKDEYFVDA